MKKLTKYGFISHMEDYLRRRLVDPKAQPDEYLKSFGIDGEKALSMLLKRTDPSDEDSSILKRKERIVAETDENGEKTGKDKFHIKYTIPRSNYTEKMEKLYNEVKNGYINEEDGGATSCEGALGDGGRYDKKISNQPIQRRTIYITEAQYQYLMEEAELDTAFGDFGYDAPMSIDGNDETLNHRNIMAKAMNYKKEKGVNYAK